MTEPRIFNNNFKFHHKNSSSPSICIYAKSLHTIVGDFGKNNMNTLIPTPYEIGKIIQSLQYQDNDFKYFFKIWPVINHNAEFKKQCESLDYETKIYNKLRIDKIKLFGHDYINQNHKYTLTPILSESNGFKLIDLSKLLGVTTQKEYDIFIYVFYTWLLDPSQPNTDYKYKEDFEYNETVKQNIIYIQNNLRFNYLMTPVIPNTRTFGYVMDMVRINQPQQTLYILMKNFCNIFVNIIKGIKTLKESHVNHNDLHDNNIFVNELNNGINTFIYDYDRSYCEDLDDNPMLNNRTCFGTCKFSQCNRYDDWLDFFKILHYVFKGNNFNFNMLLLCIITGNTLPLTDDNVKIFTYFINIINWNQFLHYNGTIPTCSWYFDDNVNYITEIRDYIKKLLISYEEIIRRIEQWVQTIELSVQQQQSVKFNVNNENGNSLLKGIQHTGIAEFEQKMRDNDYRRYELNKLNELNKFN